MKIERLEGNTEVTYQDHGTVIAVFIKGDTEQDVNERFWSFWNHGATQGEFHWVEGENNGYFWTTPDKLKLSLERAAFHKLLNDNPDWEKVAVSAFISAQHDLAEAWYNSIEKKSGQLAIGSADISDPDNYGTYSLGTIKAESPTDYS